MPQSSHFLKFIGAGRYILILCKTIQRSYTLLGSRIRDCTDPSVHILLIREYIYTTESSAYPWWRVECYLNCSLYFSQLLLDQASSYYHYTVVISIFCAHNQFYEILLELLLTELTWNIFLPQYFIVESAAWTRYYVVMNIRRNIIIIYPSKFIYIYITPECTVDTAVTSYVYMQSIPKYFHTGFVK